MRRNPSSHPRRPFVPDLSHQSINTAEGKPLHPLDTCALQVATSAKCCPEISTRARRMNSKARVSGRIRLPRPTFCMRMVEHTHLAKLPQPDKPPRNSQLGGQRSGSDEEATVPPSRRMVRSGLSQLEQARRCEVSRKTLPTFSLHLHPPGVARFRSVKTHSPESKGRCNDILTVSREFSAFLRTITGGYSKNIANCSRISVIAEKFLPRHYPEPMRVWNSSGEMFRTR